jgi:hypothetical protein
MLISASIKYKERHIWKSHIKCTKKSQKNTLFELFRYRQLEMYIL